MEAFAISALQVKPQKMAGDRILILQIPEMN